MSIKFITDSASDILPHEAEALGITCIPINITFGENTYEDGVTLSHKDFYAKLAASNDLPTTSQINPATFEDHYKRLTENGDSVVVITLSSELSGTYQNAVIAAEDYEGKVFVVDGLNATAGQRILLLRGLELEKQGLNAKEIADTLNEEKSKVHVVAIIDTLEYLKKGGRISATVAFAGGLLSIKPGIEVKDGKVVMAGTARGAVKCHAMLKDLIEKYGGINFEKPYATLFSGTSTRQLDAFIEATPEIWQGRTDILKYSLGGTIGTHIGPGAYGIAFFEK